MKTSTMRNCLLILMIIMFTLPSCRKHRTCWEVKKYIYGQNNTPIEIFTVCGSASKIWELPTRGPKGEEYSYSYNAK